MIPPPGYYLLFIINKDGIPSLGRFVLMRISGHSFDIGDVMPEIFEKVDPLKDPPKYVPDTIPKSSLQGDKSF
jgi:hypothetical protein